MYLTTVPQDSSVLLLSSSPVDGIEGFLDMITSVEYVTKDRAIQVLHDLNNCKYHPDAYYIAVYNGYECHPVLDEITGICIDVVTVDSNKKTIPEFCEYLLEERLHLWPDGTYCGDEDLEQYLTFCSDDYASYGPTK